MSRRTQRIGKVFQQEIGRILLTELADPRLDPARTSVTRIHVQEDLLRAKVYVSILGTEAEQARGLEALQGAAGRVQSLLREKVRLRYMPVLEFHTDEQFKGALRTWEAIREAMDEIHSREQAAAPGEEAGANEPSSNVQDES